MTLNHVEAHLTAARAPGQRGRRVGLRGVLTLVAVPLICAALASCSSSGNGSAPDGASSGLDGGAVSSTASSSGGGVSGAPVKVTTMATINSNNAITFKAIGVVASAYGKWVNAHGGVAGRPLDVTVCDDKGTAAGAAACAHQAVSAGDVAVVGSFTQFGSTVIPILEQGKVAWFGPDGPAAGPEVSSKISFPLLAAPTYVPGLMARAIEDGCPDPINVAVTEGAEALFTPLLQNAAKAYGRKIGSVTSVPFAAQDYSPEVQKALGGGAKCVLAIIAEDQFKAWMPAWAQAHTSAKLYGVDGNLDSVGVAGYESAAEGAVIADPIPDISVPAFADLRQALANANAPSSLNYNSQNGSGTWTAYVAFTNIAASVKGTLDHTTFLAAASATTSLNTGGILPALNLTREWTNGPKGYNRLFNCGIYFSKLSDGKVVPLTTKPQNAAGVELGTAKLGPVGSGSMQCAS